MSRMAGRSAAFLAEMGVGAHWTLRHAQLSQVDAVEEEALAEPQVAPQPEPVAAVAAAPRAAVTDDAFAAALADAVAPAQAGQPSQRAVEARAEVKLGAASEAEAAAEVDADAGAYPHLASRVDAAVAHVTPPPPQGSAADSADNSAYVAGDDSNSWFDDAPTPARPVPVSAETIAMMDWAALKTSIATCTRCDLCATRRGVVPGRGAADAQWIALGAGPTRLDEKENRAITGDAGQLLDNMLKAIGLTTEADVYVTHLVKCRPSHPDGSDRAPTPDEVTACAPYLERELALTGAAMIVTFGQAAVRRLLGATAARGKVLRHGALPVVATYHPDDLLRRPEDKAKAWGDLCLARAARDGGA
ncbi:uracil-DNA glycosylase [Rugamonas sp.]|uniref:uracil-DNA glycosylase n=1 Tax=Rugamonas sp. TaxID=1926287 RepID=UPI0025F628D1|nr:uracil-DNA glycosylase [Rugamonas sp.]